MKKINLIEKKNTKEKRIISLIEPQKLLSGFFNGFDIEFEEECEYES